MWSILLNFLGGPIIKSIVDGLVSSYKAKLDAQNTTEAHAIDLAKAEIMGEIQNRETEASIIRQEQGWWLTALPRPIMGLSVSFYVSKVLVWDLCLGLGTTPEVKGSTATIVMIIISGYFGGRTIEKVARIFKR